MTTWTDALLLGVVDDESERPVCGRPRSQGVCRGLLQGPTPKGNRRGTPAPVGALRHVGASRAPRRAAHPRSPRDGARAEARSRSAACQESAARIIVRAAGIAT